MKADRTIHGTSVPPLPSPLVGEGGSARRAETDEGAAANTARLGFARRLRRNATEAEKQLWRLLRDRRFVGFKFRRQVPILGYVADFLCYEAKLILELDGSQHAESEHDRIRDARLAAAGFRVLRIWNNELTSNRQGVRVAIWSALVAAPSSGAARHLLPRGEKEEGAQPCHELPSPLAGEGGSARRAETDEGAATNTALAPEHRP